MEKNIKVSDILSICNGKLVFGNTELICGDFCKDSREVKNGDTYIGIKGEKFNGSNFYEDALKKGATICILQDVEIEQESIKQYDNTSAVILVEDVVLAIQQLATYKRKLYDIPVIAVTGSVGKTSTKDIIASVLATKYNVLKTEGNYNNHIGVPMTILRLKNHDAMVVEMGMNNLGEISVLTKIAQPTVAVITNVGTSHIGNLGSRENILKAKLEILEGLKENGTLIINNDNDMLNNWYTKIKNDSKDKTINISNKKYQVNTFGIENKSNIQASEITLTGNKSTYTVNFDHENYEIEVPVGGNHFIYNSLCAMSVGKLFGISIEKIKTGIKKFELSKNRMEINEINGITIINDCYNANYDSMKAAIEFLHGIKGNRKIAVLGDMLELGEYSKELHEKVGIEIAKNEIDELIVVGEHSKNIAHMAEMDGVVKEKIHICDTNIEAVDELRKLRQPGDVILIKASNGMKFKEIVEAMN